MAADTRFAKIVSSVQVFIDILRDFTLEVDAASLEPGIRYFYRFISEGVVSSTGITKILPVGEVARFRMGIASCSIYPQGFFNAYRDMSRSHRDGNQGLTYRSFEIGNLADLIMLDTCFHGRDKGFEYAEDVPFKSQWYDISNPTDVRRINANAASNLSSASIGVLKTPFDLHSGKPELIYDNEHVKKLALTDLPRVTRYLPDFARFKDELLSYEKRTIPGNVKGSGYAKTLRALRTKGGLCKSWVSKY